VIAPCATGLCTAISSDCHVSPRPIRGLLRRSRHEYLDSGSDAPATRGNEGATTALPRRAVPRAVEVLAALTGQAAVASSHVAAASPARARTGLPRHDSFASRATIEVHSRRPSCTVGSDHPAQGARTIGFGMERSSGGGPCGSSFWAKGAARRLESPPSHRQQTRIRLRETPRRTDLLLRSGEHAVFRR